MPLGEGLNQIDGTDFAILVSYDDNSSDGNIEGYHPYSSAYLNVPKGSLSARNRKEGDKILDGGMHKKLKKLMCDKKVSLSDRNSLPLILSGEELIYAPLCAVSDGARANKKQFEIKISIYKK